MKAFAIICIIYAGTLILLSLGWVMVGENDYEIGLGFWNLVTAGLLLASGIVSLKSLNK